ncbi:hypothetical protein K3556_02825 [Aliiroseovarius sp. M344]|uniref:hypothetical protein n=1 Tax=Aliiroseovarius sp. M344 TaxID=2867010 RepID=UPI0021ADFB50|nr:hypothetical protein [Aliiroseovarius sp. M344]UWQ14846.1 hypothetical protein K3556_02825 [Aliiroseovarius sp. M344]
MKSPIAVGAALVHLVLGGMLILPALEMVIEQDAVILLILPGTIFVASGVFLIVMAPRPGEDARAWLCVLAFIIPYVLFLPMIPIVFQVFAR